MRIVFMGTPEFAVPSLRALCEGGYEVVGVFTQPDRPKGRGNKVVASPVKQYAVEKGIQVFQPQRIRKDGVEDLKALAPDLCVTAAFGQILSQEILDIPRIGTVNVHASLLPRHRGSAPINWAILQGDTTVGVTTMMTDRGIDTGDMLLKAQTPYIPGETAGELTLRLAELGASLLIDTLRQLEAGTLTRIPQDEAQMTYDPMLTKEMGIVDWTQRAVDIVNRIHGLNPWPGCSTAIDGGRLKLLRAERTDGAGRPGEIITADARQGLVIAAGEGAVCVKELQAPGGKPMSSKDYLRGHPMQVGTVLKEENVDA
ncbi:MAG: methionyl-tRNA formyltransferase [Clostridiales bacterium]|nr:methionyl-tRNA formyltransferase [Clostridiales bacterium]